MVKITVYSEEGLITECLAMLQCELFDHGVHWLLKLGPRDAWYVFVVRHVWMCQKDSSNLTHTVCFDVSIYRPISEPDVTNEQMTHLLKLSWVHTMRGTYSWCVMCECVKKICRIWHIKFALMCQFTAQLANQMWWMNKWHIYSN